MNFMQKCKRNGGFTLVELIVVIAILAILAGVAVPAYTGYIKKAEEAADQQLLGAVNTAFAAACLENGVDAAEAKVNSIVLDANGDVYTMPENVITNVTVDGKKVSAGQYDEAFKRYFAGNEGAGFKTVQLLYYANGVFSAKEMSEAYQNAYQHIMSGTYDGEIGLVQGSAYANIGATNLLNQVNGVTGMATEMLNSSSSDLYKMVFDDPSYLENLATTLGYESADELDAYMGTLDDPQAFLANSTVLSVATTVNSDTYDKAGLTEKLASGKLSEVVGAVTSSDNGLAEAALIYGLYTAYAPDQAGKVTGIDSLGALANDKDGFMEYLGTLKDPNSQASKDLEGYYAALDIVNGTVSNDKEVAKQVLSTGYTDAELNGILSSIIGG